MKKKLLLKIKRWILTLRKAYNSKKDLITDFIYTAVRGIGKSVI